MIRYRIHCTAILLTIITTTNSIAGKMYQCRSVDGSVEFSNVACTDSSAERAAVMELRARQPHERSSRSDLVERANRFSAQRRAWSTPEQSREMQRATANGQQPLTYSQRKALRNAEVGRPEHDNRLTPAQNAAAANAHNAKARAILGGAGLNPDLYIKDQEVIVRPPQPAQTTAMPPQFVPSANKWCEQQGGVLHCW